MSPWKAIWQIAGCIAATVGPLPVIIAASAATAGRPGALRILDDSQSGSGGGCECNELAEVRCYGLNSVPRLSSSLATGGPKIYRGIYIARQNISRIGPNAFSQLRIRKIVLEFNPLEDRIHDDSFRDLNQDLRELHLGGCRINRLPGRLLLDMVHLRHLHLWGNRLETILPKFFAGTPNLRELILWGNRLEELEDGAFEGLGQLRRLDLDHNRINVLTKSSFRHLVQLEVLHLGRNKIHAISSSDVFSENAGLRVLTLDRNGLEFVYPNVFDALSGLASLSLDHNVIEILPAGVFSHMKRLKVLDLRNNRIERPWEATFSGLASLRVLYLSENRISRLPGKVFRVSSKLRHIFLDRNNMSSLGQCVLPNSGHLRSLSLTGNPLVCDCQLAWIGLFVSRRQNFVVLGSCTNRPLSTVRVSSVLTDVSSILCPDAVVNCKA